MHLSDPEANLRALAADLGYFRRKRLESRVLHFARRGLVTFADLLRAHAALPAPAEVPPPAVLDDRLKAAQERLDALVTDIATLTVRHQDGPSVPIDDTRRERGDYDPWLRLAERHHDGDLLERLAGVEAELADSELLARAFREALIGSGLRHLGRPRSAPPSARRPRLPQRRPAGRACVGRRRLQAPPPRDRPRGGPRTRHPAGQARPARRRRGHRRGPQRRGLHAVLVLPARPARQPAVVVPDRRLQAAHRRRAAAGARRAVRSRPAARRSPCGSTTRPRTGAGWSCPTRPAGTEGWTEDQLAELVTSESLVGTELLAPVAPGCARDPGGPVDPAPVRGG